VRRAAAREGLIAQFKKAATGLSEGKIERASGEAEEEKGTEKSQGL
jgi:hypothetical protein